MQDNMRAAWRLLFAGLATFALMGFGQSLFGPTLPEATRRFLLPEGEAALLVSAQWIGSAIGVATMFLLSHRIVPRHALALLTLGAAGLAAQPAWGAMLAASVVFGVGYGMATASFNPRVLKAFGDRGASMLSLLNAAFAAGAIVAPLVFVWLGSASALVFALMAGGCALVWVFAGEPSGTAATTAPVARTGLRPHWPILAFGAISVGIEASLIGLGPTALISAGVTEAHAAQYLSAFFLAFLAARVVLGFTAHRVTPFAIYLAAMVWAAACALAAAVWLPGPAFVAMGVSAGMFFPGYFVAAAGKMGDDPRVTPLILSAGLAGGIGAPFLLGALMAGLGERGFFWLLVGITVPTALVALLSARAMRR